VQKNQWYLASNETVDAGRMTEKDIELIVAALGACMEDADMVLLSKVDRQAAAANTELGCSLVAKIAEIRKRR
jgi:NACalpha-BTF3-like transcription factor